MAYDVIVIGAGSVGAPAAFFLAQAGLRTLVIDRAPSAGQGSSKAAIGGIRATHSEPAKIRLCQRSLEIFATWQAQYGDDIEWYQGGYAFPAYRAEDEQTLKALLAVQRAQGLNIQWLNAAQVREVVPDLNPLGLIGGTYSPEDGSASPLRSNQAFMHHARRLGAEFRFGERLTGITVAGGKVRGVRTDKGEYAANVVVGAAGGFARDVGALAGLDLPVIPDSHEAGITEPVAHFLDPMVVDIRPGDHSTNAYFYQHKTGQVLFCITPSPQIWGEDTRETSQFLPLAARRLVELMPRLASLRVRRTWRGLYPMTPDGSPLVGWAREAEGLLLAVGMCGQGFMLGPGVAELLTRMILGRLEPGDGAVLAALLPGRAFRRDEALK